MLKNILYLLTRNKVHGIIMQTNVREGDIMNNIKEIRRKKGIPVKYISYTSKISSSYIYLLEKNERQNPSLNIMKDIAKALNEPLTSVFY